MEPNLPIPVMMVFGTRPEAIKMAPLFRALQEHSDIDCQLVLTAQHRDLLDDVMQVFQMDADEDLNIMQHGQSLTDITSRVLYGCEQIFQRKQPALVLVHGDTTTSFAAALAAFYQQIPVGHVEAGLRTFNPYSPFPEEINRQLTGRLTKWHFAPTKTNVRNLLNEGVQEADILLTGNTVIDALFLALKTPYQFENKVIRAIDPDHRIITLTCHRRENLGDPMREIFRAIKRAVLAYDDIEIVFPVHPNPKIRQIAEEIFQEHRRIHLIEPLSYQPFVHLLNQSYLIMTDSGGVQEEAPSLGKPVMVLRTETERPEAVEAKTVYMAGNQEASVYALLNKFLSDEAFYHSVSNAINPYGDGKASQRIVDFICHHYGKKTSLPDEFSYPASNNY